MLAYDLGHNGPAQLQTIDLQGVVSWGFRLVWLICLFWAAPLVPLSAQTLDAVMPIENPSPNTGLPAGDFFGESVSISGNLIVVGSRFDDTSGNNSGRAYLFNATTGAFLRSFDNPSPSSNDDQFAVSVDISGNLVLIGAHLDATTGAGSGPRLSV